MFTKSDGFKELLNTILAVAESVDAQNYQGLGVSVLDLRGPSPGGATIREVLDDYTAVHPGATAERERSSTKTS